MFYFRDCIIEGGVDLYCPRGWAWAENCVFFAHAGTAILWHDGSAHEASKTVLKNCSFDGYDGFYLGRYHRDAQFFLLDCRFSSNMANREIYRVPTENTIRWGHRVYYWGCERTGGNYPWFSNRLPQSLESSDITVAWLFEGKWRPDREWPLKNNL
jgi:pectinesterase